MVPSFREKAEAIFMEVSPNDMTHGWYWEERVQLIEKELLEVYTMALNSAIKAIDKWSEVPTFPERFTKED